MNAPCWHQKKQSICSLLAWVYIACPVCSGSLPLPQTTNLISPGKLSACIWSTRICVFTGPGREESNDLSTSLIQHRGDIPASFYVYFLMFNDFIYILHLLLIKTLCNNYNRGNVLMFALAWKKIL